MIAAIQMVSTSNLQENLNQVCSLIAKAAQNGAKLIVLPEEFLTLGLTPAKRIDIAETYQQGPIQQRLQKAAQQNNVWLVAGTLPIKTTLQNKIAAACVVFNHKGDFVARYDKIHLFDVNVEQESYQESDTIQRGEDIVVVDTPLGKMGLSICYDVRFPELYRTLMKKGADFFVVPSAFTVPTGKVHWEVLLKARAIENLCYVIAPNEAGTRANGLKTYGHSLILSPWGEILAQAQDEETVLYAEIDLNSQRQLRSKFPALKHIRL